MPFITCLSFNGFDAVCIFQVEKSKIAFIGVIVCLPVLNQPIPSLSLNQCYLMFWKYHLKIKAFQYRKKMQNPLMTVFIFIGLATVNSYLNNENRNVRWDHQTRLFHLIAAPQQAGKLSAHPLPAILQRPCNNLSHRKFIHGMLGRWKKR